jgi:SAM-dependent methyltransferase
VRLTMADVERNLEVWESWDWSQQGDEWSASWGGTPALWYGALLPRIHAFVPTGTILEIAPGYGRWTQYLKDLCERLLVVDLAPQCIDHCRERFSEADNISYHVNDGRSLEMVEDHSVDFVFSFDSLVHAEADVIDAYLGQLARKLTPNGAGFIHHSNAGACRRVSAITRRVPQRFRAPLVKRGALLDVYAWRAETMTADLFAAQCERAGLACVSQELISWEHGPYLTDALSVFTAKGTGRQPQRLRNRRFNRDAKRMARLYGDARSTNGTAPAETA